MMKNTKRHVHFVRDYIERTKLENEQRQSESLEQIAAEAASANERARKAKKQSYEALRVSVVAVVIGGLSLLVDILKLVLGS